MIPLVKIHSKFADIISERRFAGKKRDMGLGQCFNNHMEYCMEGSR